MGASKHYLLVPFLHYCFSSSIPKEFRLAVKELNRAGLGLPNSCVRIVADGAVDIELSVTAARGDRSISVEVEPAASTLRQGGNSTSGVVGKSGGVAEIGS